MLLMCNGMLYVGQSHDVAKRIRRHADGSGSRQAKQLKEFLLVYVEGPIVLNAAVQRERQIKKCSRAKKMALILGDFDTIKSLPLRHFKTKSPTGRQERGESNPSKLIRSCFSSALASGAWGVLAMVRISSNVGFARRMWHVWILSLIEQVPVEAAVLDGFEEVRCFDAIGAGKVGDGAGDFEDAVIGAGGE